jgi:peptide/nickel transport system permease protein
MIAFIIRRLLGALLVMFAITVLTFLIFFATPSNDPAARIAGRNASPETLKQVRHDFGLDRPLPVQYAIMMKKLLWSRDLTSFINRGAKITPQIADAAPVSFSLVIGAAIVWVFFAIAMGLTAAVMRGTFVDPLIMIIGLIGISMPVFWLGEVVNLVTQSRLHEELFFWLPPLGYIPFTTSPTGWFKCMIFPWLTLSVAYIGIYSRVLRSSMLEGQEADFVRTARAKGLTERRVLIRHVLRTSMITFVSLFGLDFGFLVAGGALLTEVVFALPGVGKLTYDSLTNLDLPMIMATTVYAAFFIIIANTIVDIVYGVLDPRVRVA